MTEHDSATTPALAAAQYAASGWRVLPVHTPLPGGCSCGHPGCTNRGKHPRLRRGVHQASSDPVQVAEWWARWPDANVAIATGALAVVDIDGDRGARALDELQSEHGPLPATRSSPPPAVSTCTFTPATSTSATRQDGSVLDSTSAVAAAS